MKMSEKVIISGMDVVLPSKKMEVKDFQQLWRKENISEDIQRKATEFMTSLGRETQYFFDPKRDDYFSLAEKAIAGAISKSGISIGDIDALVFVTDTPEHTYPTNALLLISKVQGFRENVYGFDMNSNCTGMLTAIDIMSRTLEAHPTMKNVLLVSVVVASLITSDKNPFVKPLYSDGASALVLSKKEHETRGFVDGVFRSNPKLVDGFRYPAISMSQLQQQQVVDMETTKLVFNATDVSYFSDEWKGMVLELTERNQIQLSDVKHFFFSQFAKPQTEETMKKIGVSLDKTLYIGGKYGYTGINSPIFAIHESLEQGRIVPGDLIIVASVGAGYNMSAILIRI